MENPAKPESTPRPPLLWMAFVLLGVEILGLLVAAVWMVVDRPDGEMGAWGYALTMAAVILMFAALLFFGGRGLWRGMRWGRGPVISWQLLQFVTAVTMADVISTAAAWAVGLMSLAAIVGFLAPASRDVTAKTMGSGTDSAVH